MPSNKINKKELREKRHITIPIFNAGFGGYFSGSALWQNRQFVFDELAKFGNMALNELATCELENYVFQCRTKHSRSVIGHYKRQTNEAN